MHAMLLKKIDAKNAIDRQLVRKVIEKKLSDNQQFCLPFELEICYTLLCCECAFWHSLLYFFVCKTKILKNSKLRRLKS